MTLLDAVLGKLSLQITCIIDCQSLSSHVPLLLTLKLPCEIAATSEMQQEALIPAQLSSVMIVEKSGNDAANGQEAGAHPVNLE